MHALWTIMSVKTMSGNDLSGNPRAHAFNGCTFYKRNPQAIKGLTS